jgi:hypothetical protein
MVSYKIIQNTGHGGFTDFLQVVINPRMWFFNIDNTAQIYRCADNYRIAIGIVNGGFEVNCSSPYPMAGSNVPILG